MSDQAANRRSFEAGKRIFAKGDPAFAMYLVEEGTVELWLGSEENKTVLNVIEQGGIFGEMALIDSKPRAFNASAKTMCVLRSVPEAIFREKIKNTDPFIAALVRMMATSLRQSLTELYHLKTGDTD